MRVGDHQGRGALEPLQGVTKFPLLDDHAVGVAVQQVADRLHLRLDQPALGGLLVDRHHQDHQFARRHQVGDDRGGVDELLGGRGHQGLAQIEAAVGGYGSMQATAKG